MYVSGNISGTSSLPSSVIENSGLCFPKLLADYLVSDLKEIGFQFCYQTHKNPTQVITFACLVY